MLTPMHALIFHKFKRITCHNVIYIAICSKPYGNEEQGGKLQHEPF